MQSQQHDGATIEVLATDDITDVLRADLHALFDVAYADGDHAYLDHSLELLRYVAVARRSDHAVAFSLGDMRVVDLPRLPAQAVGLAGLSCVHPGEHRRGFFSRMASLPMMAEPITVQPPAIVAGRMAHPVTMRAAAHAPGCIPRPGHVPTEWQQEVASAVAALYGVADFDPITMVCRGRGKPVGTPLLTLEVTDEEWIVFAPADRARGDSILAVAWQPFAPAGWDL